jgi:hypothetical protein
MRPVSMSSDRFAHHQVVGRLRVRGDDGEVGVDAEVRLIERAVAGADQNAGRHLEVARMQPHLPLERHAADAAEHTSEARESADRVRTKVSRARDRRWCSCRGLQ